MANEKVIEPRPEALSSEGADDEIGRQIQQRNQIFDRLPLESNADDNWTLDIQFAKPSRGEPRRMPFMKSRRVYDRIRAGRREAAFQLLER